MPRVYVRHKTGSRAGQSDMIEFVSSREVLVGRDPACGLVYDDNRDPTVSTHHARIVQSSSDTNLFTIEDLSRNGTFVDGQRIAGPTPLTHGSSVRLGISGPSFIFEMDPPPASGAKATVVDFGDDAGNAPRVIITHKTGSKAPGRQVLDFSRSSELLIGRLPSCSVIYDENRDPTVGREQAKIMRDPRNPRVFTIEHLGKTNGTFVDGQEIWTHSPLNHGSTVKFGVSGPSFLFELDPPPINATIGDFDESTEPEEDENWWNRKHTISDSRTIFDGKLQSLRIVLIVAVVIMALIIGVGVLALSSRPQDSAGILKANGPAVVSVDVAWRLFDPESGRQAYHLYVPDDSAGGGPERLPVFVRLPNSNIEPVLILDDQRDTNRAIGGRTRGSGFIVRENGFVLTSSMVAAPFNEPYTWPNGASGAFLVDPGDHTVSRIGEFPAGWIPSSSRFVITRRTSLEDVRLGRVEPSGQRLEGKLDSISIGFSGTENHLSATLVGVSANNRIALVKGDSLQTLHPIQIKVSGNPLTSGDRAYLLGYGLSTSARAAIRSATIARAAQAATICPGCYRISDNGADVGFSGGPVFDDHGRLAGVVLRESAGGQKTFDVVPIEQAGDLLGLSRK
jgi:serine protease Do